MKNYPIALLSPFALFKATVYRFLKWPYLIFSLCCYFLFAAFFMFYLYKSPLYIFFFELVLLGTFSSSPVFIDILFQVFF